MNALSAATPPKSRWLVPGLAIRTVGGAAAGMLLGGLLLSSAPALVHPGLALAQAAWLLPIAYHDIQTRRAPNGFVYPAIAFFATSSLAGGWEDAGLSLLGGLAAFVIFLLMAIFGKGAMGYGDVKVACLCGIASGLPGVPALLVLTSLSSVVVSAALLLLRIRSLKDTIAFTPFLVVATLAYLGYRNVLLLTIP